MRIKQKPGRTVKDQLPPGVALAWGLASPRGRGPKPSLSIERIVATGIELADADGLTGVSMVKVAAALGVTTMALYRYVPAKEDLLVVMGDVAVGPPADDLARTGDWRTGTAEWAQALLDIYRARPWVLTVPIAGPPALPNQTAWIDRLLGALGATGLSAGQQLSAALFIDSYVRGWAATSNSLLRADAAGFASYPAAIAERLADRSPDLARVIAAGELDATDPSTGLDGKFAFAIGRVLDGLEALMR